MQIKNIHVDSFTCLQNKDISLDSGINLLYGENEAGKSSLQSFIKFMLYSGDKTVKRKGYAAKDIKKFKPKYSNKKCVFGGNLTCLSDTNDIYYIDKNFLDFTQTITKNKLDYTGNIAKDYTTGEYTFAEELLGINAGCFDNLAIIKQIQETKVGLTGEVTDKLLNSSSQSSVYNIASILNRIDSDIENLTLRKGSNNRRINRAQAEYDRIKDTISKIEDEQREYADILEERDRLTGELSQDIEAIRKLNKLKEYLDYSIKLDIITSSLVNYEKYKGILDTRKDILERKKKLEEKVASLNSYKELDYTELSNNISNFYNTKDLLNKFKQSQGIKTDHKADAEDNIKNKEAEIIKLNTRIDAIQMIEYENLINLGVTIEELKKLKIELESEAPIAKYTQYNDTIGDTISTIIGITGFIVSTVSIILNYPIGIIGILGVIYAVVQIARKKVSSKQNNVATNRLNDKTLDTIKIEYTAKERYITAIFKKYAIEGIDNTDSLSKLSKLKEELNTLRINRQLDLDAIDEYKRGMSLNREANIAIEEYNEKLINLKSIIENRFASLGIETVDYKSGLEVVREKYEQYKIIIGSVQSLGSELASNSKDMKDIENYLETSDEISMKEKLTQIYSKKQDLIEKLQIAEEEISDTLKQLSTQEKKEYLEQNYDLYNTKKLQDSTELSSKTTLIASKGIDEDELISLKTDLEFTKVEIYKCNQERDILNECRIRMVRAEEKFKKSYIPSIEEYALSIIRNVTNNKYNSISISENLNLELKDTESGEIVSNDIVSKGTQDMINIVMRSGIINYIKQCNGESIPIIMDEVFSNIDEDRMIRLLESIKVISKYSQILIFTCKKSDKEIFDSTLGSEYKYIDLGD